MQKVRYMHIAYSDGRNILYWRLVNSSQHDTHIIPNITLSEAQDKFVDIDEEDIEISYQKWLSSNN